MRPVACGTAAQAFGPMATDQEPQDLFGVADGADRTNQVSGL